MSETVTQNYDLSSLELYTEVTPVNPDANMDDRPPLPPEREDGYKAIPTLKYYDLGNGQSSAFKRGKADKNGVEPFQLTVDLKLEDPGQPWDGTTITVYPSTRVFKGTSEIEQILKALYTPEVYRSSQLYKQPDGRKVKLVIEAMIAQTPIRPVIEWQAEKDDPTKEPRIGADGNSYPQKKVFLYGMKKFPSSTDENGNVVYRPLDSDPKTNEPAHTRLKVTTYLPFRG